MLQNQKDQMKKIVIGIIEVLLLASAGYLIYMAATKQIKYGIQFRFYQFAFEHLFTFFMILYNVYNYLEDPLQHIYWLTTFTLGNFLMFGFTQIFLATKPDTGVNFANKQLLYKDFGVLTYVHFYYQINIYFGVFSIFSTIMCILFKIHDHSHRERMEEVLQYLQQNPVKATGNQDPCSICLTQYKQGEEYFLLYCGHIFHKECLKDWFKQKVSCPLCRSTHLYDGQEQ